jgi:hypothetical protein
MKYNKVMFREATIEDTRLDNNGVDSSVKKTNGRLNEIRIDTPENTATTFAPPSMSITMETKEQPIIDPEYNRGLFITSLNSYKKLSVKYPTGIKIGFPYDVEDLPKADLEDLANILTAWDKANDTYFYMDARPRQYYYSPNMEQWDTLTLDHREYLNQLLGVDFSKLAEDYLIKGEEPPSGIQTIRELIKSPEFKEKRALTNYLMQEGWKVKKAFFQADKHKDEQAYIKARYFYEYTKYEINSLLCESAIGFAKEGDTEQLGKIFEHLAFTRIPEDTRFQQEMLPDPYENATSILLDISLTEDQRKATLKEFIKVFGPISTVDTIAKNIHLLHKNGIKKEDPYMQQLVKYIH